MFPEENSYRRLLLPKMMTATSTEQRTDSSWAFLKRPPLRLRKVLREEVNRTRPSRSAGSGHMMAHIH